MNSFPQDREFDYYLTKKVQTEVTLGQLLIIYRNRLDLTQDELARILKVSSKTISLWEREIHSPGPKHLQKLCELFLYHQIFIKALQKNSLVELWEKSNHYKALDREWLDKVIYQASRRNNIPTSSLPDENKILSTSSDISPNLNVEEIEIEGFNDLSKIQEADDLIIYL